MRTIVTVVFASSYLCVLAWFGIMVIARKRGSATSEQVAKPGIAFFIMNLIVIAWDLFLRR